MTETRFTYCRICEALCGLAVDVDDGRVVAIRGDRDHPVSKGYVCPKGSAFGRVVHDPDRVTTPLRRVGGPGEFEPVSWDVALDDIATRLSRLRREHGPHALAIYYGNPTVFNAAHLTWAQGFMTAFGSRNIYTAGSQDTIARQVASRHLYGNGFRWPFPDIPRSNFVLLLGTNPLVSHGSLLTLPRIADELRAVRDRGGRVVVVDPMATKTAKAFEHIPIRAGTDAWLLAALLNVVIGEGLTSDRTAEQVTGFADLEAAVAPFDPERAEAVTGIEADTIRGLARDFAGADRAAAQPRVGLGRNPTGTLATFLADALNVVTGNLDRPGGMVFGDHPIDIASNAARLGMDTFGAATTRVGGLRDVGGTMPWVLPQEISTPGAEQVRAAIVTAGNPVVSAPDGDALAAGLAELDLLVALDFYVNETSRHAHYVLPVPTFLEREDVLVFGGDSMPRVWAQATKPVIDAPAEVRDEWRFFDEMTTRLKLGAPNPSPVARFFGRLGIRPTPRRLLDLMLRFGPDGDRLGLRRRGLSIAKLEQYPHGMLVRAHVRTGRARHHIRHRDKRVHLAAAEVLDQLRGLDDAHATNTAPLRLIGRRQLRDINSWMHNLGRSPEPALLVHPKDAADAGVESGGRARLRTSAGEAEVLVEITDDIAPGTISYPHGYGHAGGSWQSANAIGGINVNRLTPGTVESLDPLSGASHLDAVPAWLDPVPA